MREVNDYSNGFPARKIWVNLTAVKLMEPNDMWISEYEKVDGYSLYMGGNRYILVTQEEGNSIIIEMMDILLKMMRSTI